MVTLFCDFETRSAVDIKKAGADVYARHPSTDILCMGWTLDEEPVQLWTPEHGSYDVLKAFKDCDAVVAHNAPFELAIWNYVGVKKYRWPPLRPEQVICTMAMSYAMALPGALEDAAPAAGLAVQKDCAGHRVMLKLSKPKKILESGEPIFFETLEEPEKFEILYAYCKQDVEVERQLYKRLVKLPPEEHDLWVLDHKINQRGVQIDVEAVKKALVLIEIEKDRLNEQMREATSGTVVSTTDVGQLTKWVRAQGFPTEGLAKGDVLELLKNEKLPPHVRLALETRQKGSKSSTAKLTKMISGVCEEGRARGLFQYWGAGATSRFAGRRIQLHNMPRPRIPQSYIDHVFEILKEFQ